jgi:hypothetical protein
MPRRYEWELPIREGTGRPSHGILLTRRGGPFQASIRGYLLAKNDRAKAPKLGPRHSHMNPGRHERITPRTIMGHPFDLRPLRAFLRVIAHVD